MGVKSREVEKEAHLRLLDLKHLLVFFRVLLDRLVEEEVGRPHADAVAGFTGDRLDALQLLEDAVRSHAPGLRQAERDDIGVAAADGRGPFPAEIKSYIRNRIIFESAWLDVQSSGNLRGDAVVHGSPAFGDNCH